MILKRMEIGQLAVFCYLIGCEKTGEAAIVDPGGDADKIIRAAAGLELRITKILLTHCHPDHIMGLADLKARTHADIYIHEDEADILPRIHHLMPFFPDLKPAPPADVRLQDGDAIQVGEVTISVIHTPGHSPGGLCYHVEDSVLTGDTLFVGSVGRTDIPGGDHNILIESVRERLFPLGDDIKVLPGHNYGVTPSSTIGEERSSNPYLR